MKLWLRLVEPERRQDLFERRLVAVRDEASSALLATMRFVVGLMIAGGRHNRHLTIATKHDRRPMTGSAAERDALEATGVSKGERLEAVASVAIPLLIETRAHRITAGEHIHRENLKRAWDFGSDKLGDSRSHTKVTRKRAEAQLRWPRQLLAT